MYKGILAPNIIIMLPTDESSTLKPKTSCGTAAAFKTYSQWIKEKYRRVRNIFKESTKCWTCHIWGCSLEPSPQHGCPTPPASCFFPFPLLQGKKSGVSGPSGVTELPRRSPHDLLLSGGAVLTARIPYFDCNETGSSPMPNWTCPSRVQQTPAQWCQQTITYS